MGSCIKPQVSPVLATVIAQTSRFLLQLGAALVTASTLHCHSENPLGGALELSKQKLREVPDSAQVTLSGR